MTFTYIAFAVIAIWLTVLSFFLYRTTQHYRKLSTRTKKESIDHVLDRLLDQANLHKKDIKTLHTSVQKLDADRHTYFQKCGFVTFNPFNDRVGGDQSFVIALLDNNNTGFVQTCMYTREGVRIYVKPIQEGASKDYELSKEEKEAIDKAA